MKQLYLDYASPAIEAGAKKDKHGDWVIKGDPTRYGYIEELCKANGILPVEVEPPKAKSRNALRKAAVDAKPVKSNGTYEYAMRAMQYMLWRNGIETTFQYRSLECKKYVSWERIAGGENRIRYVDVNFHKVESFKCNNKKYEPDWQQVPNWDFVAKVTKEA